MAGAVVFGLLGLVVLVPLGLISICVAIVLMCSSKAKKG